MNWEGSQPGTRKLRRAGAGRSRGGKQFFYGWTIRSLRQDPLEANLVIFGRRALIFFCLKALGKNEK